MTEFSNQHCEMAVVYRGVHDFVELIELGKDQGVQKFP